jgi:hypothetical protein
MSSPPPNSSFRHVIIRGIEKYEVDVATNSIMFRPNFVSIGEMIENLVTKTHSRVIS